MNYEMLPSTWSNKSNVFWITINKNHPPYLAPGFNSSYTMYADHTWNYMFSEDYDIEDDTTFFEVLIYFSSNMSLLTPQPSWLIVDNSSFTSIVNVTIQGATN